MNVFKKTLTLMILLVVMASPVLAANDHQEMITMAIQKFLLVYHPL